VRRRVPINVNYATATTATRHRQRQQQWKLQLQLPHCSDMATPLGLKWGPQGAHHATFWKCAQQRLQEISAWKHTL